MKILFISILFLLFMSNLSSQPFNQKMIDRNGNEMLIGCCTREALLQEPFATWYIKNYNDYTLDTIAANEIRKNISNKQFILFLGTWCGDSRRETPRILKIFDYCNVNPEQIKLVMVSNHDSVYKQSPSHEERGMNILRVPTLIILENNKEINRIVESPIESIEKDLLKIITGKKYLHNYADQETFLYRSPLIQSKQQAIR